MIRRSSRPALATYQIQGQLGPHETLSKTERRKGKELTKIGREGGRWEERLGKEDEIRHSKNILYLQLTFWRG